MRDDKGAPLDCLMKEDVKYSEKMKPRGEPNPAGKRELRATIKQWHKAVCKTDF